MLSQRDRDRLIHQLMIDYKSPTVVAKKLRISRSAVYAALRRESARS